MFMVLTSSLKSHFVSSPGSRDECKTAPDGCRIKQADGLAPQDRLQAARIHHPPSTSTIAIYYYSA